MFIQSAAFRQIIFTCLSISLLAASGHAVQFGKISDEEFALGAPEDYPEANAMIIIDYGAMEITTSNIHLDRIVRIKILTAAGIDEVGEQYI